MSINWSKLQAHLHEMAMSGLQVTSWEAWEQWKEHKQYGRVDVIWSPRGWHVVPMYEVSIAVNDRCWDPNKMAESISRSLRELSEQTPPDKYNDDETSDKRPTLAIVSRRVPESGEP